MALPHHFECWRLPAVSPNNVETVSADRSVENHSPLIRSVLDQSEQGGASVDLFCLSKYMQEVLIKEKKLHVYMYKDIEGPLKRIDCSRFW